MNVQKHIGLIKDSSQLAAGSCLYLGGYILYSIPLQLAMGFSLLNKARINAATFNNAIASQ